MIVSIAGPSGIVATKKTHAAVAVMHENLLNLASLNSTYTKEWEILRTNKESTALEARSLGYLAENEVVIRLSIGDEPSLPPSAGSRLTFESESLMGEKNIKVFSLLIASFYALIGFTVSLKKHKLKNQHHRLIRTHSASL